MSIDWTVVCHQCKKGIHLGQRFTSGPTFGYGSNDFKGREDAAEFISDHIICKPPLQIIVTDETPDGIEIS